MQRAPDIGHFIPQKKENLRGLLPRGGRGVLVEITRKEASGV